MRIAFYTELGKELENWWYGEDWTVVPRIGDYISYASGPIYKIKEVKWQSPDQITIWVREIGFIHDR